MVAPTDAFKQQGRSKNAYFISELPPAQRIDLWLRQSKKALPIRLDDFGRPQQEFLDFLKGFFVLARARMLLLALIEIASVLLCCKPLAISPLCPAPVASFAALRHSTLE